MQSVLCGLESGRADAAVGFSAPPPRPPQPDEHLRLELPGSTHVHNNDDSSKNATEYAASFDKGDLPIRVA